MKRLVLLSLLLSAVAGAQAVARKPDCYFPFQTQTGGRFLIADNRLAACTSWTLAYANAGFTTVAVEVDYAADLGGAPGTWAIWPAGDVASGTALPLTVATQAQASFYKYRPWVSVNTTLIGTGTLSGALLGFRAGAGQDASASVGHVIVDSGMLAASQGPAAAAAGAWPTTLTDGAGHALGVGPGTNTNALNVAIGGADAGNNYAYLRVDGWGDGTSTAIKGGYVFAPVMAFNGSSFDRLRDDGNKNLLVSIAQGGNQATVSATNGMRVEAGPTVLASNATLAFFSSAVTNPVTVKLSGGNLYGYHLYNPNAATCYLQVFNVLAPSVSLGTTQPVFSLPIGTQPIAVGPSPLAFANFTAAISVAATTTPFGGAVCATGMVVNLFYQ